MPFALGERVYSLMGREHSLPTLFAELISGKGLSPRLLR